MRKNYILLTAFIALLATFHFSEAKAYVPANDSLIISEIQMLPWGNTVWGYIELTNTGSRPIDLSEWWLVSSRFNLGAFGMNSDNNQRLNLNNAGILQPGDSYTVAAGGAYGTTYDQYGRDVYPYQYFNVFAVSMVDTIIDRQDPIKEGDRICDQEVVALFNRYDTSTVEGVVARDSALVDVFGFEDKFLIDQNNASLNPIAGVIVNGNPCYGHTFVRKAIFTKGNPDFTQSAGTNINDSEWILLPLIRWDYTYPYTTIGKHGNATVFDVTPKMSEITIDKNAGIITVPYGVRRDSVMQAFNYGPNHAWEYKWGADSSQWYVQTGDSISFFVVGNEKLTYKFGFVTKDRETSFANIRPERIRTANGKSFWEKYWVSNGYSPDTIGNIAYGSRVDTLLKYLVIEDGCSYAIKYVDGIERPDFVYGDILEITSASGAKKEYKIAVKDYEASSDASLQTIYFPGLAMWENPDTYEYTDTMLNFTSAVEFYTLELDEGTATSPAVVAVPNSAKAVVYTKRAENLLGTEAQRTITIKVMAEDDSTERTYSILCKVRQETPDLIGEPFFTDFGKMWSNGGGSMNTQIYNPSSYPINFSNYMIARVPSGLTKETFFEDLATNINKNSLVPGYKIEYNDNLAPILVVDNVQTSVELESRDVFQIVNTKGYPYAWPNNVANLPNLLLDIDITCGTNTLTYAGAFKSNGYDAVRPDYYGTGQTLFYNHGQNGAKGGETWVIFKIVNDSVLDGSKAMNKMQDYEEVDIVNGWSLQGSSWALYCDWELTDNRIGLDTVYRDTVYSFAASNNSNIMRNPQVYTGNPVDGGSFAIQPNKRPEWFVYGSDTTGAEKNTIRNRRWHGIQKFGLHNMITYVNIPYITSTVYLVGSGLDGVQPIYGILPNTTVDQFIANIVRPDDRMELEFKTSGGSVIMGEDVIAQGATLKSTSGDGRTSVSYKLNVGSLDGNFELASVDFDITVNTAEKTGVIANVPFGITLTDLDAKISTKSELAIKSVTDGADYVIPHQKMNRDTILIAAGQYIDVVADSKTFVEVRAQNGDVCVYSISYKAESMPYVLSNEYVVDQEAKVVHFVPSYTVRAFLSNVIVSPGATIKVVNKLGQTRVDGNMAFDDRLVVTSEDGKTSVLYYLRFMAEHEYDNVNRVDILAHVSTYPNPTTGIIQMSGLKDVKSIDVTTITGARIASVMVKDQSQSTSVLNSQMRGVYLFTFNMKNGTSATRKIVKQ